MKVLLFNINSLKKEAWRNGNKSYRLSLNVLILFQKMDDWNTVMSVYIKLELYILLIENQFKMTHLLIVFIWRFKTGSDFFDKH